MQQKNTTGHGAWTAQHLLAMYSGSGAMQWWLGKALSDITPRTINVLSLNWHFHVRFGDILQLQLNKTYFGIGLRRI